MSTIKDPSPRVNRPFTHPDFTDLDEHRAALCDAAALAKALATELIDLPAGVIDERLQALAVLAERFTAEALATGDALVDRAVLVLPRPV